MITLLTKSKFIAFAIANLFFIGAAFSQATVATDYTDYPPGSTVNITGTGFLPNETITLQVIHVGETGDNATSGVHAPWNVTADADGNISATWMVPLDEDELGATLLLTADGQDPALPARHAEATFTDASSRYPNGVTISPTTTQTICQGISANALTATITTCQGSNPITNTNITYTWYYNTTISNTISVSTVTVQTSSGLTTNTTTNSFTPPTNAASVGTRYYFCQVTEAAPLVGSGCGGSTASGYPFTTAIVEVIVKTIPVASVQSGNNQTICSGTAFTAQINSDVAGSTFALTSTSNIKVTGVSLNTNTGVLSGIIINTANTAQTQIYTVTPSANGCAGTATTVTATVNPLTIADAGPDPTPSTRCGVISIKLSANLPAAGETGAWTIISGTDATGSFSDASKNNATFSGTAGGSYTLRWTITHGVCTSFDDVVITFNEVPSTSNAGPDQTGSSTCGLTTVTLAANNPQKGTGAWTIASGTDALGSFSDAASYKSDFTGTAGGTYHLLWTVTNSPCTASSDEVVITFNISPTTAVAGANQKICIANPSATLAANTPTTGTGAWSVISGPNTSLTQFSSATTPANPTTDPLATFTAAGGVGTYILRWTITNGPCTSTSNVTITVRATPTAGISIVAPNQSSICTGGSTTIMFSGPANGVVTYKIGSIEQTPITLNNGGNANISTGVLTVNTTYTLVSVKYGDAMDCNAPVNGSVTVTVVAQPVNPTLLAKIPNLATVCAGQNVSATFNAGSGGLGCSDNFEYSTDGGTSWTAYTGGNISTTDLAGGSVMIHGRHNNCTTNTGCVATYDLLVSWDIVAQPVNPTLLAKTPDLTSVCAGQDVSATFNAGSGGLGCTDNFEYSTNGGSSWAAYTPGNNINTTGLGGGSVQIHGRHNNCSANTGCTASYDVLATWTVVAQPVNPALLVKTPNLTSVCDGQNVSATFNAGSGGLGCSDDFEYSTNGGTTWTAYTPGSDISTTGLAGGSVAIHGRHNNCTANTGCTASYDLLVTWTVAAQPVNPTLNVKTPNLTSVSAGQNVSATFYAGSGGLGCTDNFEYSTDGGTSWTAYTAGSNISTTGLGGGSVMIHGRHNNCTAASGCTASYNLLATWIVTGTTITITPGTQQYSDKVTFAATLSPATIIGLTAPTSVDFYIGTGITRQLLGSAPLIAGVATLADIALLEPTPYGMAPTGNMAPGAHTITAEFIGEGPGFTVADPVTGLTITKENTDVTYTGLPYFSTVGASSCNATITLSATVKDITALGGADVDPGDIRNATVTFHSGSIAGPVLGTPDIPVVLVSAGNTMIGTASSTFTYTLGSTDCANKGTTLNVYTVVSNYYKGDNCLDPGVVTISVPGSESVTGGGYLIMQNSLGSYAGTKTNFGFTMKWTKSGSSAKGQANIIIRRNGRIYQLKSNAINSLSVNGSIANFSTKATLKDITDPVNTISYGNKDLFVNGYDVSTSGQLDEISILLMDGSTILYSSHWNGTQTIRKVLGAGNIQVRSSTPPPSARIADSNFDITNQTAELNKAAINSDQLIAGKIISNVSIVETFSVKVSPNPSSTDFKVLVKTTSVEPVTIRVTDAIGRVRAVIKNAERNSVTTFGINYPEGSYFAEVMQGDRRKMIKLIKLK